MRARARLGLLLVTAVTLLLTALGSGLVSPATAGTTNGRPKAGQCHQLTWRQVGWRADTKKPVSCSAHHNLQTIAVVTSPTSFQGMTPDQQTAVQAGLCEPKLAKALGRTAALRAQTAYSLFFFGPTPAQIARGARWVRCDVGLVAVDRLVPLHGHLSRPILHTHLSDSVRLCGTAKFYMTPCTHQHVWRSMRAFVLHQSAYPTVAQVAPLANRRCPRGWDVARWSTPTGWADGNHAVVCYAKTRK